MNFNFDNTQPIYLQLVEQLKLYIISGKLSPGERLPSVRDLALQARVNPNTMQRALTELENEKLIRTERTNGKYITDDHKMLEKYRRHLARNQTKHYLDAMRQLGLTKDELITYLEGEIK